MIITENTDNERVLSNITRSLDLLPDPYAVRGYDSRHLYANLAVAKLVGLRKVGDIIDRLDYEIPSLLYEDEDSLKAWRLQDQRISETRKPLAMLEVHPDAVNSPYIIRKVPLYNSNNEIIGVFCSMKYLEVFSPNDFVRGKLPGSLLLNRPDKSFSEREYEIIFLKLQGMTSKSIGNILCLSPRTIEHALERLYNKAGVNHIEDFISFCEQHDFHRYLPHKFLQIRTFRI
ncbi:PAS and GerE domain-containing putative transcriptional regulator [Candidatus Regiella insecticola LSR1]|uniref:PAS and GerE domain-containing putative transcriptional regulator n=1 Tax=Candidatus Regiella insecticola LSR1 TaxID=663321 RepID=E0WR16_9ENTR|nr:PAS and helix-turn-helix domain-containing protein [Candidatus Regiella insecticola]EFL92576.1 PAS and GerE domain-containing putative transcriptional regulator [Candidatus Regiella insecticola LSR1]